MGKFDGVLLASDFDDTLYATNGTVPAANIAAIRYFISEGGRFTVATGRAYPTFSPYAHLAPINAPVVLSNGSAIYDFEAGKLICQTVLPDKSPLHFTALCAAFPSLGFEAYHDDDIYVYQPNIITQEHMKKVGASCAPCPIESIPTPWTKAIVQQDTPVLLEAQKWLLKHYGDHYEAIFSNYYFLEITRKNSHKGSMILHIADLLNIKQEHIYCVGDNQNDIPMLAVSAIPFAPSNCSQLVKDFGATVLCHCDDGVISDIIEHLDKRY